jgi:hypothetical protein
LAEYLVIKPTNVNITIDYSSKGHILSNIIHEAIISHQNKTKGAYCVGIFQHPDIKNNTNIVINTTTYTNIGRSIWQQYLVQLLLQRNIEPYARPLFSFVYPTQPPFTKQTLFSRIIPFEAQMRWRTSRYIKVPLTLNDTHHEVPNNASHVKSPEKTAPLFLGQRTQISIQGGVKGMRMGFGQGKNLFGKLTLPAATQHVRPPKRVTYIRVEREAKRLKTYTESKLFQIEGCWRRYGSERRDGRRMSCRIAGRAESGGGSRVEIAGTFAKS